MINMYRKGIRLYIIMVIDIILAFMEAMNTEKP